MTEFNLNRNGPVVVGGVGGSGTRVVSEFLESVGVWMGECRKPSLDNKWFAHLFFGNAKLFFPDKGIVNKELIREALDIFKGLSISSFCSSSSYIYHKWRLFFYMAFQMRRCSEWKNWIRLLIERSDKDFEKQGAVAWGWKEPISHIYLPYLNDYFPEMKYIHVVRHGLDMALSQNRLHLGYWADFLNVSKEKECENIKKLQYEYWVRANRQAMKDGKNLLGDRFMILRYEDLCESPELTCKKILNFLNLKENLSEEGKLKSLISKNPNINRYKKEDPFVWRDFDLSALEEFGYVGDVVIER